MDKHGYVWISGCRCNLEFTPAPSNGSATPNLDALTKWQWEEKTEATWTRSEPWEREKRTANLRGGKGGTLGDTGRKGVIGICKEGKVIGVGTNGKGWDSTRKRQRWQRDWDQQDGHGIGNGEMGRGGRGEKNMEEARASTKNGTCPPCGSPKCLYPTQLLPACALHHATVEVFNLSV